MGESLELHAATGLVARRWGCPWHLARAHMLESGVGCVCAFDTGIMRMYKGFNDVALQCCSVGEAKDEVQIKFPK